MCGIFGGYDRVGAPFGDELAQRLGHRIRHRGPDDHGHFERDGILIGSRRLSIIDLVGGHQPMFSDDGQVGVVQNGEIYNYVELSEGLNCKTKSDTEVILRLYERYGLGFVQQLNGMFAIAILDRRARQLILYRDRVGKKPLYLHDDGSRLLFASEIKSLLAAGIPREMDHVALDAYLTYNWVPPPATLFKGVRHLLPGHMLTVDASSVREEPWWQLAQNDQEERTEASWQTDFLELLEEATRIRLRSDVPLGAFLSGGTDSSTVVRLMSAHLATPPRTFTIGFRDPRFDESPFAEQVAKLCGADHTCEVVESNMTGLWPLVTYHNDQPHGDASFMPMYRVSELARRHVTVVLTGDGGDELFAGYNVHRDFFARANPDWSQAQFERAYYEAISVFAEEARRTLYTPETAGRIGQVDSFSFCQGHFENLRHLDRVNQTLGIDVKLLLPGNNLVKPDKMAMAVSLEPRAPFLDVRMIDFAFRIPGKLKLQGGETKWIYKRAIEKILPRDIVYRAKQMFTVPIGEWFKDALLLFVSGTLLAPRTLERGLFLPGRVKTMIEDHCTGRANYTRQLRLLIALELWHRIFIDENLDHAPTCAEIELPAA